MKKNKLEQLKEKIYVAEPDETFYVYVPTIKRNNKSGSLFGCFEMCYVKAKVYAFMENNNFILFACVKGYFKLYELTEYNFKTIEEYENERNKEK